MRPTRVKSEEQAINSLMNICARKECSSGEARARLLRWGVDPALHEGIIKRLLDLRFIDDYRFTELFIREKTNLSGWGERRIRMELQRKGLGRDIIDEQLMAIDKVQLAARLDELLQRRLPRIKGKNSYEIKSKLLRYGATLGYDYSMLSSAIERLEIEERRECDEELF